MIDSDIPPRTRSAYCAGGSAELAGPGDMDGHGSRLFGLERLAGVLAPPVRAACWTTTACLGGGPGTGHGLPGRLRVLDDVIDVG